MGTMTYEESEDTSVSQVSDDGLDLDEIVEAVPTASDALEEEQVLPDSPPADDKDAKIKFLEEQLRANETKEKEARKRSEAKKAYREAPTKYKFADPDLLKELFNQGKPANEINRLAKISHYSVAKALSKVTETATQEAQEKVADAWGHTTTGGESPSGEMSGKQIAALKDPDAMIANFKNLKKTDTTSF